MTEKQPQTCYVHCQAKDATDFVGIAPPITVKKLTDRYIFTKEELEAYVSEKLQECKRQKMNLCSEVYELRDKLIEHGILKPAIINDISRKA